jgi:hypothetical protein
MVKKISKVVLVVLMLLGAFIAVSNMLDFDLQGSARGWVHYDKDKPACEGIGDTCFDFT